MLKAIWAQSRDGVIGDGKDMPWYLPEDLTHFKDATMGSTVIMGRATWESFPERYRPLPGRENFILSTRAPGTWSEGGTVIDEITQEDAWIIGGGKVYKETLPRVQQAVVTIIDTQLGWMENAVHAPDLEEFTLVEASDWILSEKGHLIVGDHQDDALRYRFCTYERNQ